MRLDDAKKKSIICFANFKSDHTAFESRISDM